MPTADELEEALNAFVNALGPALQATVPDDEREGTFQELVNATHCTIDNAAPGRPTIRQATALNTAHFFVDTLAYRLGVEPSGSPLD